MNGLPDNPTELVAVVAANIRRLREQSGLNLTELANEAGIGKSTLSMLEAGNSNPSVETLWAIASALGVTFGQLVEPHVPSVRVVRAGEALSVQTEGGVLKASLLEPRTRCGSVELYFMEGKPGVHNSHRHLKGTVEHLFVISGRVKTGPVGEEVELGAGDLVTFPAGEPHRYEVLESDTRMMLIMSYP